MIRTIRALGGLFAALALAAVAHAQVINGPFLSYPLTAPDGSTAAPSYSFTSDPDTGLYWRTSGTFSVTSNGGNRFEVSNTQTRLGSGMALGWASSASASGSLDTGLYRDAANTLALRNGSAAPQTLRIYNDYTDASNYERGFIGWISNRFFVGTDSPGGTGTARELVLSAPSATSGVIIRTAATDRWSINTSGHLLAQADNSYDIGASGATRPRTGYFGTSVISGGNVQVGSSSDLAFGSTRTVLRSANNGDLSIRNAAGTDFGLLQLGGITASFPAAKRVGATIQVRLADDSAPAALGAASLQTTTAYTVATLPTCNAGAQGTRAHVTDATAPTWLGALTGGGAVVSPVFCNGSAWVAG